MVKEANVTLINPEEAETDEELKTLIADPVAEKESDEVKKKTRMDDPRALPEYTFEFKYKDGSGKDWSGEFVSKIPTIQDRQGIGILRAQLSGGLPSNSLDPLTSELNLIIAELTFRLKERPKWAENLRAILDFGLVQALYEEVASHEAFFFGWSEAKGSGAEGA